MKSYDTAKFIAAATTIHNNRYDYRFVDYKNIRSKVTIKCHKHGEFKQRAKNHLAGQGCPKCKYDKLSKQFSDSKDGFITKAKDIHGNKYDYAKVDYIHSFAKVEITCPAHGSFWQTPNSHLRGRGCPDCGVIRHLKYDYELVVEKAIDIHNKKYHYPQFNGERKSTDRIVIICPDHGQFSQTIKSHLAGHGCKKCCRLNAGNILERFRDIHGEKYAYDISEHDVSNSKIRIMCPHHGGFYQTINNHFAGHGCRYCNSPGGHNKITKDEFVSRAVLVHNDKYDYDKSVYINNKTKIRIKCNACGGSFHQSPSNHLAGNGCPFCASASSKSRGESEVLNYVKSISSNNIVENDRRVIEPYELDIFIPDLNLAVEYHGDYYHSYDENETKQQIWKHHNKATLCEKRGISLIQIFEHEWNTRQQIIKSILKHKLKNSNRIYARRCQITEEVSNDFFEYNHLYGHRSASITYGLRYNDQVVAAMSFSKCRHFDYEIIRYAGIVNHCVIGGAGKLFAHFIRTHNPESILSYADRRFGNGELYLKLGFECVGVTRPGYKYWKNRVVYSRQQFQKHKLPQKLVSFHQDLTEAENMFMNGYRRMWDAGHYKMVWTKPK